MEAFINYLEEKIAEGKAEIAALEADGRKDDANFAKIGTNIYDICRTVSKVHLERTGAGRDAVLAQLNRFRREWGAALERAKEHDDIDRIAVEEAKMAALEDIFAHFPEVTGE